MTAMTSRTAQMSVTPRGIRIGIATVPRQRIEVTQDAALIQKALLAKPRDPDFWPMAMCAACGLAVVVMHFAGWLPGGGA